jgi:hypothetical protein
VACQLRAEPQSSGVSAIFAASAADIGGLNSRTIPDLSGKQKCRVPSEIKSKLHSYNLLRALIVVNVQGCLILIRKTDGWR